MGLSSYIIIITEPHHAMGKVLRFQYTYGTSSMDIDIFDNTYAWKIVRMNAMILD